MYYKCISRVDMTTGVVRYWALGCRRVYTSLTDGTSSAGRCSTGPATAASQQVFYLVINRDKGDG